MVASAIMSILEKDRHEMGTTELSGEPARLCCGTGNQERSWPRSTSGFGFWGRSAHHGIILISFAPHLPRSAVLLPKSVAVDLPATKRSPLLFLSAKGNDVPSNLGLRSPPMGHEATRVEWVDPLTRINLFILRPDLCEILLHLHGLNELNGVLDPGPTN